MPTLTDVATTASVPAWIGVAVIVGPVLAVVVAVVLIRLLPAPAPRGAPAPAVPSAQVVPDTRSSPAAPDEAGRYDARPTGATVAEIAAVLAAVADVTPNEQPLSRAQLEEYVEAFRALHQQAATRDHADPV